MKLPQVGKYIFFALGVIGVSAVIASFTHIGSTEPTQVVAQEALTTPQAITLYDTNGTEIASYNQWLRDEFTAAATPGFQESQVGEWAGSWGIKSSNDNAYFAVSINIPTNTAGAMFVKGSVKDNDPTKLAIDSVPVSNRLDGQGVPKGYLEEDGLQAMAWLNDDTLLITGMDPAYTDHWEAGNLYSYQVSTDTLTKIRCHTGAQEGSCGTVGNRVFPGVVHFLGVAVRGDTVYLTGSRADETSSDPILFKSADAGQTWQEAAVIDDTWYRGSAILPFSDVHEGQTRENAAWFLLDGFTGGLYRNAVFYSNNINSPVGTDWEKITQNVNANDNDSIHSVIRPVLFKGTPVYAEGMLHYNSLYHLKKNESGVYTPVEISLDKIKFGRQEYAADYYRMDVMVATEDYLYIVADDNSLYRSDFSEPISWTKVASFGDNEIISMHYWEEQNAIIAASKGLEAQHFLVDLSDVEDTPDNDDSDDTSSSDQSQQSTYNSATVNTTVCTEAKPLVAPELLSIDRDGAGAKLNFISVQGASNYYVRFGLGADVNQYGAQFELSSEAAYHTYTIKDLAPQQTYSFSIRAQNGCQPGEWSETLSSQP